MINCSKWDNWELEKLSTKRTATRLIPTFCLLNKMCFVGGVFEECLCGILNYRIAVPKPKAWHRFMFGA